MRPFTAVALALVLVLLPAAAPARAGGDGEDSAGAAMRNRFRKEFDERSPERKAAAFRLLDIGDAASLPLLYEGFRVPHWLVRGAAALAASRIPDGPLRFQLRLDAMAHEEDAVREGVVYAMAEAPLDDDGEALAAALADRSPSVRRDAARGLRALPSRGALRALIEQLRRETDARVRVWMLDTLQALVVDSPEPTAAGWEAWWRVHKDDEALRPPADAEPEAREFGGIRLEVVSVPARRRGTDRSGRAAPTLFVLDPFGWKQSYLRPYLDALEDVFHVLYIRLPSVQELTGTSGFGSDVARYPVERLAKAFDALRADRGVDRVVLLAEGATAWVAEAYAAHYGKRTAGLILVNGWLDAPSYVAAVDRLARHGTADERLVAEKLLGRKPRTRTPDEGRWIARVLHHHSLVDKADLLAHHLWLHSWNQEGFVWVPAMKFSRRTKVEVPALFLFPADSPLSGHPEAQRIRDAFPESIVAPLQGTRGLPWVDVHDEFHRVIRGFVDRHHLADQAR